MLLHLIKLLLQFLTLGYTVVITGYAVNNVIKKLRYGGNGTTANEKFMVLAELIRQAESRYRRIKAAQQGSPKNASAKINSNAAGQPCKPCNPKWKRKPFPLFKTGNYNFSNTAHTHSCPAPLPLPAGNTAIVRSRKGYCNLKNPPVKFKKLKNCKAPYHAAKISLACTG